MSSFWLNFTLLLSVLSTAASNKKGYYTIVAPGTIRPGSVFHVSFTLNDFHKSCWFNISLVSNPGSSKIYGLESIEVKPGTTKLVELQMPSLNGQYQSHANLAIHGYRGIISEHSELIFFESPKFWAFIQTNKLKYKPGDLVEFRVICIDQLTLPAKLNEDASVEVYDAQYNLIRTFLEVKFVQGVFRSQFQLSDYPTLGEWTIKVNIDKLNLAAKSFDVEQYDLPKFDVVIVCTKKVIIDDDQMVLDINASYFYGEPVQGNLTIVVSRGQDYGQSPLLERNYRINGKTTIVLDLKNDLRVMPDSKNQSSIPFSSTSTPSEFWSELYIEATVIDDLDEEESRTVLDVGVYQQPYKIELEAPRFFDPTALLNIKCKVDITDLDDNPILMEVANPINIVVGCREYINPYNFSDTDVFRKEFTNEIIKDSAVIQVPNKNYTECFLYAEFEGSISSKKWVNKRLSTFHLDILTESPQEGKELAVRLTNSEPFDEFSYEIVSKGDIIQSDQVKVPYGKQRTHVLRLNVTYPMVPKITIYVHFIQNKTFFGQLKDVLIERANQNSIKISTESRTKPGESVHVNVTTDEGSYVGLMGLDRRALQTIQQNDILNAEYVTKQLASVYALNFYQHTRFNGRTGDLITFSNVFPPGKEDGTGVAVGGFAFGVLPFQRIRQLFADSWLFMDFEKTPAGGLKIIETVPDSITTWALTGFSINSATGLTFTKNSTDLKVFQEFFVSLELPSFVKDGEVIEVPVYISNYMNLEALTYVTIETDSKDLLSLDGPEATIGSKQNVSILVPDKKREKLLFYLKPLKQGQFNVTVKAVASPVVSDAVRKTLKVQPQGVPYAMSKSYLVHLPEKGFQEDEISIDIPENAVSGSQRVEVSVMGDIFGPLMKNLQTLGRVPYGNCEENTRLIVSNSIVLKYLKVLNYSNPSLEGKLRRNVELGYQNQLSFTYLDGSFGLFEQRSERTGDIWATVFALWGLRQVNESIEIDPWIMKRGLRYLKSQQQQNGCYKSASGIDEDVKITVFALMVFLMDEESRTTYNEVISKGLEFLYNTAHDLEYSAISVLSVYALLLGKHKKAGAHLEKLTLNARLTSKQMVWTKPDTLESHLKTTAESLISLFESQPNLKSDQSLLEIVRGLIISKKEETSIINLIALQTLIKFVETNILSRNNLQISLQDDRNKSVDFQINPENSQILQTFEVSQSSLKINVQSKGHGFAMLDVRYHYNLLPENQSSSFYAISISVQNTSKRSELLKICSSAPLNGTQNSLTKMEVNLQSGFVFMDKNSQEEESRRTNIKAVQVDRRENKAVVYFEFVDNEACVELGVRKTYNVFNSRPGWVVVYGAHDKSQESIRSFKIEDFRVNTNIQDSSNDEFRKKCTQIQVLRTS